MARELHDLTRALGGALIFGVPLLMTMEMWWLGEALPPWQPLALLGVALAGSYALVRAVGFKRQTTMRSRFDQAVHAVAVGAVASLGVLVALNRIGPETGMTAAAGMVAVQALPLALGASVANAVFKRGEDRHGGQDEGPLRALAHKLGAALAGGTFVAFTVAATEEVPQLAAELTVWHQLAVMALSLAVAHLIVFQSGYHPEQEDEGEGRGGVVAHAAETASTYVVALVVAAVALLAYNRGGQRLPLEALLPQVVVLGLPAAIGGAAGRLVL